MFILRELFEIPHREGNNESGDKDEESNIAKLSCNYLQIWSDMKN